MNLLEHLYKSYNEDVLEGDGDEKSYHTFMCGAHAAFTIANSIGIKQLEELCTEYLEKVEKRAGHDDTKTH